MDSVSKAFIVALVFQAILLTIFILLFCWLRPKYRHAYATMCFGENAAELPGDGFFDWIKPSLSYSIDWIYANRGLDSAMYIKFLTTCTKLFCFFCIIAFIVLLPVFGTGEDHHLSHTSRDYVEGMNMLSMSNLNDGSDRFWAPTFILISFTILFWAMFYLEYEIFTKFRVQTKSAPVPENFVVKIRNPVYPQDMKSIDEKKKWLFEYFNRLFPNEVAGVTLVVDSDKLTEIRIEEAKCQIGLEKAIVVKRKTGTEPQHKLGFLGLVGEQVESIPYYVQEIKKKRDEATEIMNDKEVALKPVAWITFKSIIKAQQCANMCLNRNPSAFIPSYAPEYRDVFWPNIGAPVLPCVAKTIVSLSVTTFIIFFYIIPITFVQGLTNLTALSESSGFSWLKPLIDGAPGFVAFIEGVLPPIVLIIFMILIIPIFRALTASEGYESISEQARSVLNKYFSFLVFNIFLATTLSGAVLAQLSSVMSNPTSIVSLLASSIPGQGNFFMLFILAKISGAGMSLLNPGRVIVPIIFHKWLSKSERDFRAVETPPVYAYDIMAANDLLIVVLSITYAPMYPLILFLSTVYFGLQLLAVRYNVIFAFEQQWDGKGTLWPTIFSHTNLALLICQITVIGVMIINLFPGVPLLFPLIPFTILFWIQTSDHFSNPVLRGAADESPIVLDFEVLNDLRQQQEKHQEYPQLADMNEATGLNDTNPNEVRLHRHPPTVTFASKPAGDEENQGAAEEPDYSPILTYYVQPTMQPMTWIFQKPTRIAQFRKHQPA